MATAFSQALLIIFRSAFTTALVLPSAVPISTGPAFTTASVKRLPFKKSSLSPHTVRSSNCMYQSSVTSAHALNPSKKRARHTLRPFRPCSARCVTACQAIVSASSSGISRPFLLNSCTSLTTYSWKSTAVLGVFFCVYCFKSSLTWSRRQASSFGPYSRLALTQAMNTKGSRPTAVTLLSKSLWTPWLVSGKASKLKSNLYCAADTAAVFSDAKSIGVMAHGICCHSVHCGAPSLYWRNLSPSGCPADSL